MPISNEALAVLAALKERGNVLLTGAPSCGKTHLMQEVIQAFTQTPAPTAAPPRAVSSRIPLPPQAQPDQQGMPSPLRSDRQVFTIAFSANTKPRHFTSALVPSVDATRGAGFKVAKGVLVQANAAAVGGAASLLVIDELNRGPAVSLFGDAIVSIEPDKRLGDDDRPTAHSWPMQVLNDQGQSEPQHLSRHLYILAAMNEADASIEPIDVAFLRRFRRIPVLPRPEVARAALGAVGAASTLPGTPTAPGEVAEAAIRAWAKVNERISIGRAAEYQLGHGVFLSPPQPPQDVEAALQRAVGWWEQIYTHVREVFFGDAVGLGIAINAGDAATGYRLEDVPYGLDQKERIIEPTVNAQTIYALLNRVANG